MPNLEKSDNQLNQSQNDLSQDNINLSQNPILVDKNDNSLLGSTQNNLPKSDLDDIKNSTYIPYGMQQRLLFEQGKTQPQQEIPVIDNTEPFDNYDYLQHLERRKQFMSFRKETDIPRNKRDLVIPQEEKNKIIYGQTEEMRKRIQYMSDEEN